MRLLVADDDPDAAGLLRTSLRRSGHVVDVVASGVDATWMATEVAYDAVLLDVNMPPPDGFEVCRLLRERGVTCPVVFVTGRDAVPDRVAGLDAGGDDYLVKPFSVDELEARLRAIERRSPTVRPSVLRVGDVEVDPASRQVSRAGTPVDLTDKEFLVLEALARRPGEVLTRGELQDHAWDFAFEPRSNVVDAVVRRLRAKVDRPFGRSSIRTHRGAGYQLMDDEAGQPDASSGR